MSKPEHQVLTPPVAEVRPCEEPHTIGVWVGERCLQTWHTMADDFAYSHATHYAQLVNDRRRPGLEEPHG